VKNISNPWITVQYEEFKFVLCSDVMLNITMKRNLKTVISYVTHSCWKMCFSSVVHSAVLVFAIYLTLLSTTKKIIKYRLQQFTSVINPETIALAIWNISAAKQAVNIINRNYITKHSYGLHSWQLCVYIYINKAMQTIIVLQYHNTILMVQTVQKFWFIWIYF